MHMLDTSKGREAIAFVGETPWHKFGQRLTPDADIATWTRESGLDFEVQRASVKFDNGYEDVPFKGRDVLYRSDTLAPLSVVSADYNIVQPAEIMAFFEKVTQVNGFTLETAGALDGGRRVWALAKVAEGAAVLDTDVIEPYLLLATSFDKSLSTIGKYTKIRVVCHNTLTASAGYSGEGQSEADKEGAVIRIPHSVKFDADAVRLDLGIVIGEWERFLATARKLARTPVNNAFAEQFLKMLLPAPLAAVEGKKAPKPVEESKAFRNIMALFNGGAMGAELVEANGTAYGLLNAVTEYVDHSRGRDDTRLSAAWFGAGESLKNSALELLERTTA